MAYIDSRPHETAWGTHFAAAAPLQIPPLLRRMERDVLLASRRDSVSSLRRTAPLGRIGQMLGFAPPNRLADPRLEALRRFAVLLRHQGDRLPASEHARIISAGFSALQVTEIRRLIDAGQPPRRSRWKHRYVAAIALAFAIEAVIFRLASAYFSDGLVGFFVALTTAVASTPLITLLRHGPGHAPR